MGIEPLFSRMFRYFLGTALKYSVGRVIVGVFFTLLGSYLLALPAIEDVLELGQRWSLVPIVRLAAILAILAGIVIFILGVRGLVLRRRERLAEQARAEQLRARQERKARKRQTSQTAAQQQQGSQKARTRR